MSTGVIRVTYKDTSIKMSVKYNYADSPIIFFAEKKMKTIILMAFITIAAGLMLANLYTSIVDAKSWGSNIPDSIATARDYFKTVNPALALVALILFWKVSPSIRLCLAAAFILYLSAEALTFLYFYPRNETMFKTAQLTDSGLLTKTWSEWNMTNWVRTIMLLAGISFSFQSLHQLYILQS